MAQLTSLRRKSLPPQSAIMELAVGLWPALALRALVKTGVLDRLAREACLPATLARELQLDAGSVRRVLRLLAGYDVVRELDDGRFELTRIGKCGVHGSPAGAAAFLEYVGEPWQLGPWGNLEHTLRTGEPAFTRLYGTNFFEYLQTDPDAAQLFDAAMSSASGLCAEAIVSAYGFKGIQTIADIGGGNGLLLAAILHAHQRMRGILFDTSRPLEGAEQMLRDVRPRVQFVAGNFFESIPCVADAYLLSSILRDWDDDRAAQILRNVHAIMPVDSRVLIVECILEPDGRLLNADKLIDVQMLTVLDGRVRTREEFESLFADCGLRLRRIIPTVAAESILEVVKA